MLIYNGGIYNIKHINLRDNLLYPYETNSTGLFSITDATSWFGLRPEITVTLKVWRGPVAGNVAS